MTIRVGHILRHEDESGVSGTGIVAEWVEFSDGEVVVHWLSHTPSTNHYRNFKQVDAIHGHGGKTEMIVVWEEPNGGVPSEEDEDVQSAPTPREVKEKNPPGKTKKKIPETKGVKMEASKSKRETI